MATRLLEGLLFSMKLSWNRGGISFVLTLCLSKLKALDVDGSQTQVFP